MALVMERKKTRGRQRIEMKLMENSKHRLVTFSKRRSGLYKKACELSILCGVEIAIVAFSPAGNPFAFASSSIKTVVDKFVTQAFFPSDDVTSIIEARPKFRINELNKLYNVLLAQEEAQDELTHGFDRCMERKTARRSECWWDTDLEMHSLDVLEQIYPLCEDFLKTIHNHSLKLSLGPSSSSLVKPCPSLNLFK